MLRKNHIFALAAALISVLSASAQTITTLVKDGDVVPGAGTVINFSKLAVNNNGDWLVNLNTDAANFGHLILKNGVLFLREGDPVTAPPGAANAGFGSYLNLDNSGNFGAVFALSGTGGTTNDSGVYFNSSLVIQEGNISAAPQFSANTPYLGFPDVFTPSAKLNDNNQIAFVASVDDSAIAGAPDGAVIRAQVNGSGGLISETVIAKESDILPGHDQPLEDFATGPHNYAINDAGSVMYVMHGSGATTSDHAIYIDTTLVAREGSPSPVAGRNYAISNNARVNLNNSGQYVINTLLDGATDSNAIIIKNGAKFIQEGDTLPAIGGTFTFTSFATQNPIYIDDSGNVLWWGDWNDPNTNIDTGQFLNDTLLLQEGVTMIDGLLLDEFRISGQDNSGYQMSDNGQWVIVQALLQGGVDAVFMIQVPEPGALSLVVMAAPVLLRRRRRVAGGSQRS